MGRYASYSQEVLYRDGKLVGFNAGYGRYSEHEYGYNGDEQMKSRYSTADENKSNPFNGEIVENPDAVHIMKFSNGNVWLTNDSWTYASLLGKTEEERLASMEHYVHNGDRKRIENSLSKSGENNNSPEVIALWSGRPNSSFDLISTTKQSSELLSRLYSEMQKGNVAISSDYSFIFKDRGLSFVLLDQLTPEDLMNKQMVDNCDKMAKQIQQEYKEYLKKEGLDASVCFGKGGKYPVEFWNVQISNLSTNVKRRYST